MVATVIVVAVFAFDALTGGGVRAFARAGASAAWTGLSTAGAHIGASGLFATRAALAAQNAALQAQVLQLQEKVSASMLVGAENAQLRSLVHLAEGTPGITAPITSSFRASPYGTFTIGAGTSNGVRNDELVVAADGAVIGRVTDVSAHDALVLGLFAPRQTLDVLINGVPVTLKGSGGGAASGDAPRGASIATGDVAVAPSLGQRAVGVVGNVEGNEASASTHLLVRLPSNLESLQFVYVETGN